MSIWPHIVERFIAYSQEHALFPAHARVLLAVSGGIDSMMLMELMAASREQLAIDALGVAYVDHGLRPEQTPAEADFVTANAKARDMTSFVRFLDIEVEKGSLQDAARQARRTSLEQLADTEGWTWIATGHHLDDQAETLLLRLLRGTSSGGLAGIAPKAGRWLHPLLPFSRDELAQAASERQVRWHEDPSNTSFKYLRNQVRHELIPHLETTYNPQIRRQLVRLATQVRDDEAYFTALLDPHFAAVEHADDNALLRLCEGGLCLSLQAWDALPTPLQWRCIQRMVNEVLGGALPLQHIAGLVQAAREREGEKQLSLPGEIYGTRRYNTLLLTRTSPVARELTGPTTPLLLSLQIGAGDVDCWCGVLRWRRIEDGDPIHLTSPWEAYLPTEAGEGWCLRNRQPGDILSFDFGRRPLKKWLIDAKIPKSARYVIPLLVQSPAKEGEAEENTTSDATGHIGWIVGHRRLTPMTAHKPDEGWWLSFREHS